ncbi:galactokinase [Kitasatospora acidiphila]|uniref:GHMP family kinase ATP-binding protein n=1 Tax=Kitasatospora acidiphila TaxID=2567942 RepID=UPI003C73A3B1
MTVSTGAARATVPTRACLAGEDLDWLGGRSVCVALDLPTTVVARPRAGAPGGPTAAGHWGAAVWDFLRARLPDLGPLPPETEVSSDAPVASGLSSSTALIVALFEAFSALLPAARRPSRATLTEWAYLCEFEVCRGGGMDQLAVSLGGAVLTRGRPAGLPELCEQLAFPGRWSLIVVDSRTAKSTQDHIRTVRAQAAARDPRLAAYLASADAAAGAVWENIRTRDLAGLTEAMRQAHRAMRDHQGMSTPFLERLRRLARSSAGFELKLSGAGGGGALVGVCDAVVSAQLADALRRAYRYECPDARVLEAGPAAIRSAGEVAAAPVL